MFKFLLICSLVGRCNRLRTLDITNCQKIPWNICASLCGLFYECFETFEASKSGDLTGTIYSEHRSRAASCRCTECSAPPFQLHPVTSLNKRCFGRRYNLKDCKWALNHVFGDAVFPYLAHVEFGNIGSIYDVIGFIAVRCPAAQTLSASGEYTEEISHTFFKGTGFESQLKYLTSLSLKDVALDKDFLKTIVLSQLNLVSLDLNHVGLQCQGKRETNRQILFDYFSFLCRGLDYGIGCRLSWSEKAHFDPHLSKEDLR